MKNRALSVVGIAAVMLVPAGSIVALGSTAGATAVTSFEAFIAGGKVTCTTGGSPTWGTCKTTPATFTLAATVTAVLVGNQLQQTANILIHTPFVPCTVVIEIPITLTTVGGVLQKTFTLHKAGTTRNYHQGGLCGGTLDGTTVTVKIP